MAQYDLANATNASNMMELAQSTNEILGGYYFGIFLVLIIGFVTFVALKGKGYTPSACFATASWLCMLVALFLRPMDLLGNYFFWAVILMSAISTGILFLSGNVD